MRDLDDESAANDRLAAELRGSTEPRIRAAEPLPFVDVVLADRAARHLAIAEANRITREEIARLRERAKAETERAIAEGLGEDDL